MIKEYLLYVNYYKYLAIFPQKIRAGILKNITPKTYRLLTNKDNYEYSQGFDIQPYLDNKCIFIHIPKCGGISINKTLFGSQGVSHINIRAYEMILTEEEIKNYFKFTIVRNPWDKLLSAYNFLKLGGLCQADNDFTNKELAKYSDFNTFVIDWVNNKSIYKISHFYPQTYFISNYHSEIVMDYIGRFEEMQKCYEYISHKLQINKPLLHVNKTKVKKRIPYQDVYSDEARKVVEKVYRNDINELGYEF